MKEDVIYTVDDLGIALDVFNTAYMAAYQANDTRENFYCGITDDLDRRKSEHNVEKYAATIECDSFDTSTAVEEALHNDGFDTGEQLGNGTEKSIFVYMYRKIPGVTNE